MKHLSKILIFMIYFFSGVQFTQAEIASNSALVIIDVQKEYSETGGVARVCPEQADRMIGVINRLIDLFESKQMDIIYILQEGAIDNPLDSRLKVVGDLQYKKRVPNSFSNPNFKEYLKSNKIRHLYVTGLAAEFCVNATIQDAARRGYFVTAVSDGIAAGKCSRLEETLQEYEKKRIKVVPSETIIQE